MSVYDYTVPTKQGEESLKKYEGKVLLIVNTATECGFTPQYEPLETMYEELKDEGFEILDIPSNQFGQQAPGSDDEIQKFCEVKFNTKFPRAKKSDVNGPNELPLYTYLKEQKGFEGLDDHSLRSVLEDMFNESGDDWQSNSDIKWNFTKFLVDRDGTVVNRFEPTADLEDVKKAVKALL